MKLSKFTKRVITIFLTLALVFTGFLYTPENTGAGTWINVTHIPSGAWGGACDYRLGITDDNSDDGLWYLKTAQNQWGNYTARYSDADKIDGFVFDSQVYNNAGGATIYTTDLKSQKNLSANTEYKMTVVVDYGYIGNDLTGSQYNYIQTTGGVTNMNLGKVVQHDSQEIYTANVVPGSGDFSFKLIWKNNTADEAQKGQITIESITFSDPETTEAPTVQPGGKIAVTGVPAGAWGGKKDKYQLGVTSDTSADGKWYLEVSQNEWGNWAGSYEAANTIEGFKFYNEVYNNAGGIFLWSTDLKSEYNLTPGVTYNMSVTIEYTGVTGDDPQNNFIFTEGGATNMNTTRTVALGNSTETYTGQVVPSANNDFVLRISWSSLAYETADVGDFEVTDVTFTEDTQWNTCTIDDDFHTIGNAGFQYKFRDAMVVKYKGGTDIDDPLNLKITNTINNDHDFLTKTPNKTVTPGHIYKLTYNIANEGPNNSGANFYAKVANADDDSELATNYDNPVAVNANDDVDIELTFMAPESGEVYVEFNGSYTPVSTYVLTPSFEDTTPDAQPITAGQWGYAGANNTGWQYFARANGSAYYGGTSMGDNLTINYGTYVNDVYTCIVRSPITAVDSTKSYTGTMTIDNNSKEALQAGNLHVSVHWYNSETGQDGEISAATSVTIPAGGSQTFDLSYTAPDSGYIFYEASTSYTPGMSSFTYSATHTPPADGRYDVAAYKSGSTATYPTESGKIFAGWYDDTSYTQVHSGNTGLAYAKFIDEKVLDVKFQKKDDKTAVRFVSTIDDCLDYTSVGFKFTGDYGAKHIDTEKSCTKVYKNIKADGQTLTPSTAFDNTDSAYFFTYSVRNMDGTTSSTWTVTPFYVTPDGTRVYGTTKDYSM